MTLNIQLQSYSPEPVRETGRYRATAFSTFDPDTYRDASSPLGADSDSSSQIDPELFVELVPVLLAMVVFTSAFLAGTLYATFGLIPSEGPAIEIASLAGLIAYGLFRRAEISDLSKPSQGIETTSLRVSSICGALAGVFLSLVILVTVFGAQARFGYGFLGLWFSTSLVLTLLTLSLLTLYRRVLVAEGRMLRRVAVYGSGELAIAVARAVREGDRNTALLGIFEDAPGGGGDKATAPTTGLDGVVELARRGKCDRVIFALPLNEQDRIMRAMGRLSTVPVAVQICTNISRPPCRIEHVELEGSMLLLNLQARPLSSRGLIVKAIMDYTLASIALIALAPLLVVIAVAIKLDSPGPVLFTQPRGGYRQKPVKVFKFRTMFVHEEGPEVLQARRDDPRITRFGRFLRRTSLDEVPQLFNVLRGELSLVGPRPHALSHDKHYATIVDRYTGRFKIKPGITGWAQINGCRGETSRSKPHARAREVRHLLYRQLDGVA